MERQSSFGSENSAATAKSAGMAGGGGKGGKGGKEGVMDGSQNKPVETALFGVLFTLSKEKANDNVKVALLTILVDFFLIMAVMLTTEYPYYTDTKLWIWKFFWGLEFHKVLASFGYTAYLIVFYLLSGMLFVSVALCFWVAWCFKNDTFPFLWPIKFLRVVVSLFFGMLYIAALNIFLSNLECYDKYGNGVWYHHMFKDSTGSYVKCFSTPHLIHIIIAAVSSVTFAVVAMLLFTAEHELEPMTRNLLASPHSMCELRVMGAKTIIVCADILLWNYPKIQGVAFVLCCYAMTFWSLRMVPQYVSWVNCLRSALFAALTWIAAHLCVLTFLGDCVETRYAPIENEFTCTNWGQIKMLTYSLFIGVTPAALLGGALAYGRMYWFFRIARRFVNYEAGMNSKRVWRFSHEFDVELAARMIGRCWDEDDNYDPQALDLAETILKGGLQQFPDSAYLHIVYANFLIEVRGQGQAGWQHLETARKCHPNLSYKFSIFTREQEHKQKSSAGAAGEGSVDLVSFVEFQRNQRMLIAYHKQALVATRDFWRLLMRERVNLRALTAAFRKIDKMESMADKTYKVVLERYPKSVKLLRSYGNFLETVKNDPWMAQRYYQEADKQEELQESAGNEIAAVDDGNAMLSAIDDKNDAVITINAVGIIQMANKVAYKLLGYKKGQLEGKNVSMLMPNPFSSRHNSYLKNYITTGKAKIIDSVREVVALHAEKYVFPARILVTKASGTGMDSIFMGVLKPIEPDTTVIKAWLMTSGTILAVDESFMDYAGWGVQDLLGRSFGSLSTAGDELDALVAKAAQYTEAELAIGKCQLETVIRHKYGGEVPVNIKLEMGGTETQRILVVTMKRLAATTPLLVFSSRGRVTYSNTSAANMLGYASADMKGKDISAFLPQPFGLLHHKWLKELQAGGGRPAPGSCRNAITHTMVTSNGTNIPVHLDISAHAVSETEQHYTVAITKSTPEAGLDERRLLLRVNENGYVVAASPSPASLFGLEPRDLRNRKLSDVVDVFSSWTQQGNDLVAALNGFAVKAATDPGASWRVGVLPVGGADKRAAAAAADRKESKVAKALKRDRDDGTAVRPAVMQIEVDDSEEEMGGGIGIAVRLWAVDRLSGVLELHNGEVQKADLPAGLIFGLPHSLMVKQPLSKFVRLPPGASMDEAFGMAESKRGGMKVKEAGVHRTGPKKPFEGRHADGYGVQLSVQAAHKVGTTGAVSNRILLVVKIARAAVGSVAMVHRLIQEAQLGSSAQEADLAANLGSSALAPRAPGAALGATGRGSPVPGLNFSKLKGGADGGGGGGSATARRTDRSGAPATVTARGVELGIDDDDEDEEGGMALPGQPDKPGSGGGSGGDGPPRTITSPSDNTNDTAMTGKKKKGAAGGGASARPGLDELVSDRPGGKQSARVRSPLSDGDDGDSHDGDRRRGNGGMAVSSDEGDDDAEAAAAAARRKAKKAASSRKHNRPLTEEEQEAILEAKSKVKVKDWLARGYAAPGAGDEEVDAPPTDLAAGLAGKARGGGDEEGETSERSSEHASQIGDSASAVGGDFSRGKRLKRLTKLLSGRRAMSALYALRQHVWVVVAILLLAHLGCFLGVLMNLNQQKNAVEAIHAYGLAEAEAHSAASYGRAVEAALRGDTTFFGAGDLPELTNRMTASINAFEELHQGLYLGFGGLRPPDDADQKTVWDDDVLDVSFYDTATPPALTTIQDGLWSLGNNWLIAAREVVRLALLPGGPSPALGENRNFLFVRDNTPGALHDGYAANVQLELQKAETRVQALRRILVALMVVEGIIICLAATLYLFYVLYRVVNTRVALFTIFLVVPNSFVRSLALKSVNLASEEDMDGDGDEDGGGDKKNTGKGGDGAASGAAGKAAAAAGDASALATLPSADDASAGTGGGFGYMPQVKVPNNADGSRGKGAASGAYTTGRSTSTGFLSRVLGLSSGRVVNGKELVETGSDIYILCYPFLLWACLVIAVYAASYAAFANQMFLPDTINSASLMGATQRVLFYSNELVLQPAAERVATAATLSAEVAGLEHLYEVTLYGGTTNEELVPLGFNNSYDSSGSLFTNKAYPELLFRNKQCLRLPGEPIACVADTDAYYQVSFNALDPLVRRLLKEATFLVEDAAVDHTLIDATQPRFQYMWNVARLDLAGGMQVMSRAYVDAAFGKFSREQLLHIGVEVVSWLACGAFLLFMFRPFISVTMQESKRVAELLTQLPSDMDVEAMAERSWLTVMGYSLTESASKAKKTKKLSKKKRVSFWVWLMGDNRVDDGDDESDDVPPLRNRNGGGGGGGRNRGWVDEAPPRGGRRAGPAWEDEEDEEGGAYGRRSAPPPPRGSGMTPRSSARSPPGGSGGFSAKLAGHNADGHMLSHRSNGGGGASGGPAARDLDTPMGRRLMATPLSDRPPMSSGRERRRSVEFHDAPMPPSAPLASARSGASGGGTGRTRRRSVDFAEV